MTWSIIALDRKSGALGIAIATKALAVGGLCPHGEGGVGVISTQATTNPMYGVRGIRLLAEGVTPAKVVERLVAEDEGREHRQLHMIDVKGRVAARTGSACVPWCGQVGGKGVSVAGNMLAGPQVVEATLESFLDDDSRPFGARLLKALRTGEAAGGDKRGRQSAALRIYGDRPYPLLDLRVDDHLDPLRELARLYVSAADTYLGFIQAMPSVDNPSGVFEPEALQASMRNYREHPEKTPLAWI
ncbi:MAG: DUF1028 domain-containing protein [Geminicoccaceae bacterium]|nr:DUF1028 domain-containing protein [Geminicoccaceae bacterium]MCB9943380.1 DUF1028 domain-containing protein [Geminicoccaceae bacterium]